MLLEEEAGSPGPAVAVTKPGHPLSVRVGVVAQPMPEVSLADRSAFVVGSHVAEVHESLTVDSAPVGAVGSNRMSLGQAWALLIGSLCRSTGASGSLPASLLLCILVR